MPVPPITGWVSKAYRINGLTIAIALVFTAFWCAISVPQLPEKMHHDFLTFYNGWKLAADGKWSQLYDLDAQRAVQRTVSSKEVLMVYGRPPVYALIFAPVARIPYTIAWWLWLATWMVVLAVCCWWLARRFHPDALIIGALGIPVAFGIAHGQDAALILALIIISFRLLETGHDFWAGAVAAICCFKPHLVLMLPILLLAHRHWRAFTGFATVGLMHLIVSLYLVGLSGLQQFATLLFRKDLPTMNPSPQTMPNLQAIFHNFGADPSPMVYVLIGIVVLMAIIASRGEATRIYAVFPIASILITPHAYYYDATMFLLSACLINFEMRSRIRPIAQALATPAPYFLAIAGSPWPIAVPLLFLSLLGGLAWENLRVSFRAKYLASADGLPS